MDRITKIKRLCHQIEAEYDEFTSKVLQEERERADQAIDEDNHLKLEQDKCDSLRTELEGLQSRKAQQAAEMRVVNDEDEELSHRLKLVQTERFNEQSASEGKKETLKCLVMDVVEMEHEKENRVEKMKKDFHSTMKLWKIYKAYLDMRIALVKPDLYVIGFSASKSIPTSLTLRSSPDLKDWEVMEANGKPELKNELTSYLVETKDIIGVMCSARHCYRNKRDPQHSL